MVCPDGMSILRASVGLLSLLSFMLIMLVHLFAAGNMPYVASFGIGFAACYFDDFASCFVCAMRRWYYCEPEEKA